MDQKEEIKQDKLKMKKEHSYNYWVKNDPNYVKVDCTPQKIDITTAQELENNKENGFSKWNTAGTWEEKQLLEPQIKKCLEELFSSEIILNDVCFYECLNISGEGVIIYVRQKKRLGYKLKFTIKFKYQDKEGEIKYLDFCDDGDREYEISFEDEKEKQRIRNCTEELEQKIIESLKSQK